MFVLMFIRSLFVIMTMCLYNPQAHCSGVTIKCHSSDWDGTASEPLSKVNSTEDLRGLRTHTPPPPNVESRLYEILIDKYKMEQVRIWLWCFDEFLRFMFYVVVGETVFEM